VVISRDEATAAAAMEVLAKSTGAEARRCASAALVSLGIDPDAALAQVRERAALLGVAGPLTKAVAAGVSVRVPMDAGGTVALDNMSRAEAVGLYVALEDALGGRRA
jgi:hypothetical protein